jgi:hypothetical protein
MRGWESADGSDKSAAKNAAGEGDNCVGGGTAFVSLFLLRLGGEGIGEALGGESAGWACSGSAGLTDVVGCEECDGEGVDDGR